MTNKNKIYLSIAWWLLITWIVFIFIWANKSVEDKISDLNNKITIQERQVLETYNIYKSSELNWKQAKVDLEKLYSKKRELMWLSLGLEKTK